MGLFGEDTVVYFVTPDHVLARAGLPEVGDAILVHEHQIAFKNVPPKQLREWPRSDLPGAQPVPTGESVWFPTGDEEESFAAESADDRSWYDALENTFVRAQALAASEERASKTDDIVQFLSPGGGFNMWWITAPFLGISLIWAALKYIG